MNHWRWDGHPRLPECLEQLMHICRGVHSALNMFLQLVSSVFVWVKVWGHGRPGENLDVVVGEVLCGVAC